MKRVAGGAGFWEDGQVTEREPDHAHDVLAAEAFAVPAADPELHEAHLHEDDDRPHDVLVAELYGMPAADPDLHNLHRGPVPVPEDPAGIDQPHDVLAAEEWPMPGALQPHPAERLVRRRGGIQRLALEVVAAVVLLRVIRRRRSR